MSISGGSRYFSSESALIKLWNCIFKIDFYDFRLSLVFIETNVNKKPFKMSFLGSGAFLLAKFGISTNRIAGLYLQTHVFINWISPSLKTLDCQEQTDKMRMHRFPIWARNRSMLCKGSTKCITCKL